MRLIPLALPLLTLAAVGAQDAPPVRPFDDKTLAGWHGDSRYWSVEDGTIVGRSTAAVPLTRNTYLAWDGVVGDFELRLRFRVANGNSGVLYRGRVVSPCTVAGYQADIESGPSYTGILYEDGGRAIVAQRGERVHLTADGQRKVERFGDPAKLQASIHANDWNDYVIRAVGDHVEQWINGERMVDVVDEDPQAARTGCLAFQLHAGAPMEVRFADLQLVHLAPPPQREAQWIWPESAPKTGEIARLWTTFEAASVPRAALLVATADDHFRLWLNGDEVAHGDDWRRPAALDVAAQVRPGTNVLAIEARNEGGPAAAAMRLSIESANDIPRTVVTDAGWRSAPVDGDSAWRTATDGRAWPGVHAFGPVSAATAPWGDVFASGEATPASELTVPAGYRVELVHSARIGEGSWIAMAFEPSGDVLVGREGMEIARIELPHAPGDAPRVVPLRGTPITSMGFCSAFDALYAQGKGAEGYGLYRMRDLDHDGQYRAS